MSRDSGTHCDLCGLAVTDLSDEDNVRVLTENRSKTAGERHSRLGVNLNLVKSGDLDFYRVLNCDDVDFGSVLLGEKSIKGRCLTGTRRTGDKADALRYFNDLINEIVVVITDTEPLSVEVGVVLCKDTDNRLLTCNCRKNGYTHVHRLAVDLCCDTTVLRDTLLGDVHTAKDLDSRSDSISCRQRVAHDFLHDTVDTDSYTDSVLERLDMNIG